MRVSVLPADRRDLDLIENLFQFYCYDFSELVECEVGIDGRFSRTPKAFAESRYPHIVRVDRHPAGFALIDHCSRITGDTQVWDVAEFFVMRKYRRKKVGSYAALQLFEQFHGRWELRQLQSNREATAFWRSVVAFHTGGNYTEVVYDDERWRGPVQSFDA